MKSAINALTLDLATRLNVDIGVAKQFATSFFEENADLFSAPAVAKGPVPANVARPASLPAPQATGDFVHGTYVPVVGPDGLTDQQRAAVGTVGLCQNCQQPKNAHLPGCAVASGEAPRAVTKDPLPPVQ